jgi:hypothetical protein
VAITSAVTATIVAGSLSAVRLAVDMPKYFPNQAAVATVYGIFPAVLWRASHSKLFLFVAAASRRHQELSRTLPIAEVGGLSR